ncbi:unknown (plasmid) [Haloarcula marismortui ATCC 43049]|uniref:Uncharacterized protein n=1 Tax=Haloarcula marismortui (strain ATCC 43049 / DSM 3752 / JCM 8966 / VKM B-1809) TaxID=272569 RepID=Q5V7Y9_HALMA|nr:hypothetical protein [Haloarcula marismortui]AAV44353.1 unknown [Haloarcula marismortui ATCC 43049]
MSESDTGPEIVEMEAPVYHVDMPRGMPNLWYPEREYSKAFESATGDQIEDTDGEHDEESRISILDFDGTVEVPVADV